MTWQTDKTTDSYTPAVYLEPGKPPRKCNVKAVKLDSVDMARVLLDAGKCAWVDADEWKKATDGEN